MKKYLAAVIVLAASHNLAVAQSGDHAQAIKLWTGPEAHCRNCHGVKGEGGFGPDLAGRKIDGRAVHAGRAQAHGGSCRPISTARSATTSWLCSTRYFEEMPAVAQPAKWRFEVPAGAPHGQVVALTAGCGQCHGPILNGPRSHLGAIDADFAWFKTMVYDHTTAMPNTKR